MRFWVLALLLCAGLEAWHTLPPPTLGVLAPAEPSQTNLLPGDPTEWAYHGVAFKPLARYDIKARILHRSSYYFDGPSGISNLDLAVGWGRMSDPAIYRPLDVSQGGRWYSWHYDGPPPIPLDEINRSSANTHIIPANPFIRRRLFWMREGDVVELSGYLVAARWPNGATWTSSLSRMDVGDHACEIMWVNSARVVAR